MSWSFKYIGQKAAVAKAVRTDPSGAPSALKEAIAQMVDQIAKPACSVTSDGHVDSINGGYAQVKIDASSVVLLDEET